MIFNSLNFLIFFPIVVFIYFLIPKKIKYLWLLCASYFFYMCWNAKYALLIAISTVITYFSGLLIEKYRKEKRIKKLIVAASFVSNLSILVFFKYFNFLIDNINFFLKHLNIQIITTSFDVLLPVGISFYTFQALSYTMDVYREEVKPEKNILKYALFVSFFPQLVAGPIERSKNLLHQVNEVPLKKLLNYESITNGLILMLYGLFLKMVIADRISILVNTVFDSYYMYGSIELIVAAIAFSIQIYCDFSSYSIIAIGAAQVMGFQLMENFNTPYFSSSIQEFWRRWHISLSTWFRDYLYIPMGGNRCSKTKKYFNLMVTFLVSGLWHGAQWHYILWGGVHGIYQIIGSECKPIKQKIIKKYNIKTDCTSYKGLQIFITFILTAAAWILFRANSMHDAILYFKYIFTRFNPWVLFDGNLYKLGLERFEINILINSLFVLLIIDIIKFKKNIQLDTYLNLQNIWFKWLVIIGMICAVLIYGEYGPAFDAQQFIYFQF